MSCPLMSAHVLVLFGLVEITDMDFGTLADIGLRDTSGHWRTLTDIGFGTLADMIGN